MIIRQVNSDSNSATVVLSGSEIAIISNALFEVAKTDFKEKYKDFRNLRKDCYLLHTLAKEGTLCSDDLKIGLEIMEKCDGK